MGYVGYVFVDESGTHTADDCFVVVGCCCVSEYDDATHVLRSTRDRVADDVLYREGDSSEELKGSAVADERLDSAFVYLRNVTTDVSERDETLDDGCVSWNRVHPIRFSVHDTNGLAARRILENFISEAQSHRPVQILALVSVLNPILWFEYDTDTRIDEYRVVMDAPNWKDAIRKTNSALDSLEWAPEIRFQFRNSAAVPGIQFADIAAYSRRRFLRTGGCRRAVDVLDSWRF